MSTSPPSLSEIQQRFVRRYMDGNEFVVGVRVRNDDRIGWIRGPYLYIEVDKNTVDLGWLGEVPYEFEGIPVVVRPGERGILLYA